MRNRFLALFMVLVSTAASALAIDTPLADAEKEARAQTIFHELRCVVCQGQSLAESNAALAIQMRAHVREMLVAGKAEADILESFRRSYGDTILMQPPVTLRTVALWLAPFALLLAGVWFVLRRTRSGVSL